MTDQRKFTLLAGTGVLLVLLVLAYNTVLESSLSSFLDASKRRQHYDQVIQKKGLTLHEGVYWKKKE